MQYFGSLELFRLVENQLTTFTQELENKFIRLIPTLTSSKRQLMRLKLIQDGRQLSLLRHICCKIFWIILNILSYETIIFFCQCPLISWVVPLYSVNWSKLESYMMIDDPYNSYNIFSQVYYRNL